MKCEKCGTRVSTMVSMPKRRKPTGEPICFMNLCIKCAKLEIKKQEVKNAKRDKQRVRVASQKSAKVSGKKGSTRRNKL